MATADGAARGVRLELTGPGAFVVTNDRGGTLTIGTGGDADFTPVELALAAIAGCAGLDVDFLSRKRSEFGYFGIDIQAHKISDEQGNRLTNIRAVFDAEFPAGEDGDRARRYLPTALAQSHDRLCTVTRTVEVGTPVEFTTPETP